MATYDDITEGPSLRRCAPQGRLWALLGMTKIALGAVVQYVYRASHVQLRVVVRAFHPIDFSTRYPFGWPDRAFDPIGESRSSLRS